MAATTSTTSWPGLTPAPEPPDAPKKESPRFAVYNIAITDGAFDFSDETVKRRHELREFALSVPFLSNLASQREIKTEPKLAFVLNGSRFDSAAESTPFADNRKTDARISFQGLDLVPYLGYIPGGLPVALRAGKLDADLKIDFEQAATAGLKITGSIAANGIKVADSQGRDLLGFDALKIALADVRPLERVVHLSEVALAGPDLVVARDAAGRLNLLATDRSTGATEKAAALPAPAADGAAPAAAPQPWRIQVDKVALTDGQIGWRDQTTRPAAAIDVKQLALEVQAVTWPMEKPATFSGSTAVGGAALKFSGEATDKRARVATEIAALPLSLAAPYLAQSLEPSLDGKLSGKVDVEWTQPELKFKARSLVADGLALTQEKTALASVGRFELVDAEADMTKHTLTVASFTASNPKLRIARDNEKRWMFERWLRAPADSSQAGTADAKVAAPKDAKAGEGAPPAGANTTPWSLAIGKLAVDNGALSGTRSQRAVVDRQLADGERPRRGVRRPAARPGRLRILGRRDLGISVPAWLLSAGAFSQRSNIQRFSLSRAIRSFGFEAVNEATVRVCFVMSASASTSSKRPTLASAVFSCVSARPSATRLRALNLVPAASIRHRPGRSACRRAKARGSAPDTAPPATTAGSDSVATGPLVGRFAAELEGRPAHRGRAAEGGRLVHRPGHGLDLERQVLDIEGGGGRVVWSRQPICPPVRATLSTWIRQGWGAAAGAAPSAAGGGKGRRLLGRAGAAVGRQQIELPAASRATTRSGRPRHFAQMDHALQGPDIGQAILSERSRRSAPRVHHLDAVGRDAAGDPPAAPPARNRSSGRHPACRLQRHGQPARD